MGSGWKLAYFPRMRFCAKCSQSLLDLVHATDEETEAPGGEAAHGVPGL